MNMHSTSDKNKLVVNSSYTHAINENRAFFNSICIPHAWYNEGIQQLCITDGKQT